MKRKLTLFTALVILTCSSAPAFAETITPDTDMVCLAEVSADTAGSSEEPEITDSLPEDEGTSDSTDEHGVPSKEQADISGEAPADSGETEDSAGEPDKPSPEDEGDPANNDHNSISDTDTVTSEELTDDEEELLAGSWYTWDAKNGILTLRGQLPDTGSQNGLAEQAGIRPSDIKKIVVTAGTKTNTSAYRMFCFLDNLTEIEGLRNLDTSGTTNMKWMFWCCTTLPYADVSGFDTSNVTSMEEMFYCCYKLRSLDLSGFDTSNVGSMKKMFQYCRSLKELDLTSFDTSSLYNADSMFDNCGSLRKIGLSGFDTSHLQYMSYMFSNCTSLESLDLRSFDTNECSSASGLFYNCSSLKRILVSYKWGGLNKWNGNHINTEDNRNMFYGCTSLIGSRGTTYNSNMISGVYARIDGGSEKPGYLTGPDYAPPCASVKIQPVFGGKSVTFTGLNTSSEIYYNVGSSDISLSSRHVAGDTEVFFDKPMTGKDACIYYKVYDNGQWSPLGKWGLLNVKIDTPSIVQSGPRSANNFRIYTQTKDSYLVYTLDKQNPAIKEGSHKLEVTHGRLVWGTSTVVHVPKGGKLKVIAVRNGLVTSDVMEYTNN